MSTLDQAPVSGKFGLLRAAEAVTNWRALAMCAFALVASMLMAMLTIQVLGHSPVLGLLFVLATLAISLIGYSAVGIVLMRDAQVNRSDSSTRCCRRRSASTASSASACCSWSAGSCCCSRC